MPIIEIPQSQVKLINNPADLGFESLLNFEKLELPRVPEPLKSENTCKTLCKSMFLSSELNHYCKKVLSKWISKPSKDVKVGDDSLIWNSDLVETLELQNLLTLIANRCLRFNQKESRGAHVVLILSQEQVPKNDVLVEALLIIPKISHWRWNEVPEVLLWPLWMRQMSSSSSAVEPTKYYDPSMTGYLFYTTVYTF